MGLSNRAFLNLTTLEERCCPSASIFVQSGVLSISTDVYSDTVAIRDNGRGQMNVIVRDQAGGIQTLTADGISQIDMHLRGQHDWVDIMSTGPMINSLSLQIDMGQGANDRVIVEMRQGLKLGSLNLDLSGGLGHSTVDATIGPIDHGLFNFQDHLGDAQSNSSVHLLTLPGHGERVYVD
jgi:hypothetical protein